MAESIFDAVAGSLNNKLNVQNVSVTVNTEWSSGLYYGQETLPVQPSKVLALSVVDTSNFRPAYAVLIGNSTSGYYIRVFCPSNQTAAVVRLLYAG